MRTNNLVFHSTKSNAVRWLAAVLLALGLAFALTSQAYAAGSCSTPTQSFELWAKSGTLALPDSASVTIWGYSPSAGGAAQVPGPTLTVAEGTCVQVTLHNDLTEASSLALHGQGLAADTAGASGGGGSKVYTFSATRPGTFLYEAGLTTNGARQVAMGLYGALIVQPAVAPGTYSSETVLVLSEIDPDLNAAPTTFDMGEYSPRYWLINGQAYTSISSINVAIASGSTARVRYINAGLNENSMGVLGLEQQVIAADGYGVPSPYTVVAETIPPGGTLDTLISIPGTATAGTQYALYSTAQHLSNNGAAYGGQLMYITVSAPLAPAVTPAEIAPGVKSQTPPIQIEPLPVDIAPVTVDPNKSPDIKAP